MKIYIPSSTFILNYTFFAKNTHIYYRAFNKVAELQRGMGETAPQQKSLPPNFRLNTSIIMDKRWKKSTNIEKIINTSALKHK